ncbi:hypothetical protein F4604DRAFT_1679008 [Suillus subluteus]|nr:hypothetical protein F4604DRAFT_1679008 [Suillus subluteus]
MRSAGDSAQGNECLALATNVGPVSVVLLQEVGVGLARSFLEAFSAPPSSLPSDTISALPSSCQLFPAPFLLPPASTPKPVVEDANTSPVALHTHVHVDDAVQRHDLCSGRVTDPPSLVADAKKRREESQVFHDQPNRVSRELSQEKVQEQLDTVVGLDRDQSVLVGVSSLEACHNPWIFPLCSSHILYLLEHKRQSHATSVYTPTPTTSILRDSSTAKAKFGTTSSSLHMALDAVTTSSDIAENLPRAVHSVQPSSTWRSSCGRSKSLGTQNPIEEIGFVDGVISYPKPVTARFQLRFVDGVLLRDVMAQCRKGLYGLEHELVTLHELGMC